MKQEYRIGLIGGSGLGDRLAPQLERDTLVEHEVDTPFGSPSGPIMIGDWRGTPIAILKRHGEGHLLNPGMVPHRANIFAMKQVGCTHIIASGATGSLREEIEPGDVVICDQLIDRTNGRERTFYEHAAVHVEFAEPFCPVMREWLLIAAQGLDDLSIHDQGTYICMEGPAFSTRAESHMHRQWGGDLIGMTALPEAKLAREAEIAYALVALPTDYDCWRDRDPSAAEQSLLEEIIGNLNRAVDTSVELIKAALSDASVLHKKQSPAHDALRLAIWSDKSGISRDEVKRLEPLWGRHFERAVRS